MPQAHYRHLRALRALRGRLRRGINPGQGRSARRGLGRAGHAGAQSHELRQGGQSVQVVPGAGGVHNDGGAVVRVLADGAVAVQRVTT